MQTYYRSFVDRDSCILQLTFFNLSLNVSENIGIRIVNCSVFTNKIFDYSDYTPKAVGASIFVQLGVLRRNPRSRWSQKIGQATLVARFGELSLASPGS